MHGLEAEYTGQIKFVYLDIDDPATEAFKEALGYRYQPHIFFLDGQGNVLQQWIGPITGKELIAAFEAKLSE